MNEFYDDPDAPVQPDQFQAEFAALLDTYRERKPKRVLEIGVREGGTLYQWIKHAAPGTEIIAIDIPGGWWGYNGSENTAAWSEWAADMGVNLTVILKDSHKPETIRQALEHAPFEFVFIDGDHSFEGVTADFLTYGRYTRGMIAMHDILPDKSDERIEVYKFWRILQSAGFKTQELISEDGQESRGIGVVYV